MELGIRALFAGSKGRNALWSKGVQRESEVSLGHGGVGGAGTLLCLAGVGGQTPDEWVSWGAIAPERWVQGERSLPLVVNRRNDCWRRKAQCLICATGREGCNGRRAAGLPCQDGVVLQRTSCGPQNWSIRLRNTISALYYKMTQEDEVRTLICGSFSFSDSHSRLETAKCARVKPCART
jgi:hypothetical protein